MYDDEGRLLGSGWVCRTSANRTPGSSAARSGSRSTPSPTTSGSRTAANTPAGRPCREVRTGQPPHDSRRHRDQGRLRRPECNTIDAAGHRQPGRGPDDRLPLRMGPDPGARHHRALRPGQRAHAGSSDIEVDRATISVDQGHALLVQAVVEKRQQPGCRSATRSSSSPRTTRSSNSVRSTGSTPTASASAPSSTPTAATPASTSNGATNGNFEFSTAESDTFGFEHRNRSLFAAPTTSNRASTRSNRNHRADSGHDLRIPRRRHQRSRHRSYSPVQEFTTYVPDPGIDDCAQRPGAPADRIVAAARLPRLRAGLGREHRRLRRRVRPRPRPGPARRLPEAPKTACSTRSTSASIPGIARQPDQPRPRPLRRDPRRRRLDDEIRRPPRRRHGGRRRLRLAAARRRPIARHLRLRRPGHLRPVLRRRLDQHAAAPADGSARQGHGGLARNPAADPVGEVRKPLSADGSHFVFGADQQFEADGNDRQRLDLRPQPRHRHHPGRLDDAGRRRR